MELKRLSLCVCVCAIDDKRAHAHTHYLSLYCYIDTLARCGELISPTAVENAMKASTERTTKSTTCRTHTVQSTVQRWQKQKKIEKYRSRFFYCLSLVMTTTTTTLLDTPRGPAKTVEIVFCFASAFFFLSVHDLSCLSSSSSSSSEALDNYLIFFFLFLRIFGKRKFCSRGNGSTRDIKMRLCCWGFLYIFAREQKEQHQTKFPTCIASNSSLYSPAG